MGTRRLLGWLALISLVAGCASQSGVDSRPEPLSATEREFAGRIALRLAPPPGSPILAMHPDHRVWQSSSDAGSGALQGAVTGTNQVLEGFASSAGHPAVLFLLPVAAAAGAVVGALAASLSTEPWTAPAAATRTTAANLQLDLDTTQTALQTAYQKINIEAVAATASDAQLKQSGFASVIDVTLYEPVIAGNRRRASFALLHKVQASSLTASFRTRTWYREQVSARQSLDKWLAEDGRAVQTQLLALQLKLVRDFQVLLGN